MDNRGNKHPAGLLDLLQQKTGCSYISDLHDMHFAPSIRSALLGVDESAYSVKEWNDAASYMIGAPTEFTSAKEAVDFLLSHLEQASK